MKLINSISKLTGRTGLVLKKHSPEILPAVGIGGTVASAIPPAVLHLNAKKCRQMQEVSLPTLKKLEKQSAQKNTATMITKKI